MNSFVRCHQALDRMHDFAATFEAEFAAEMMLEQLVANDLNYTIMTWLWYLLWSN